MGLVNFRQCLISLVFKFLILSVLGVFSQSFLLAQEDEETLFEEEFENIEEEEAEPEAEEESGEDEELFEEDEYLYEQEEEEEPEESDVEFAEEARKRGYSVHVSGASPGYTNSTLSKWNSLIDFRVSVGFPLLLQVGPVKFRLGTEIATFSFKNSEPRGGEFKGIGFLGLMNFPAGPSTVQIGIGLFGSSPTLVAGQSFGISLANMLELGIGIRSHSAFNLPGQLESYGNRAVWLDGYITLGYTL